MDEINSKIVMPYENHMYINESYKMMNVEHEWTFGW
jgi:hypothetical protein